jgi:hypothetical protein
LISVYSSLRNWSDRCHDCSVFFFFQHFFYHWNIRIIVNVKGRFIRAEFINSRSLLFVGKSNSIGAIGLSRATQLSISANRRSLTFAIWALNTYSFSWPRDSVKKDTIKNTIKTNDLYKLSELNYRMKICKNHILSKFKNTYFQIWLFCTLNPTNALGNSDSMYGT